MRVRAFAVLLVVVLSVASLVMQVHPRAAAASRADEECEDLAGELIRQYDLDADDITALTGCMRAWHGWIYPDDPEDPSIPDGTVLTDDERREVRPIVRRINAQLDDLWDEMPGWLAAGLQRLERDATDSDGRLEPGLGVERAGYDYSIYEAYAEEAVKFFNDPDNVEVGAMAGWWFDQRMAAAPSDLMDLWEEAARAQLGYDRVPWPWDLADPVNQEMFLRWAIDHGYID